MTSFNVSKGFSSSSSVSSSPIIFFRPFIYPVYPSLLARSIKLILLTSSIGIPSFMRACVNVILKMLWEVSLEFGSKAANLFLFLIPLLRSFLASSTSVTICRLSFSTYTPFVMSSFTLSFMKPSCDLILPLLDIKSVMTFPHTSKKLISQRNDVSISYPSAISNKPLTVYQTTP